MKYLQACGLITGVALNLRLWIAAHRQKLAGRRHIHHCGIDIREGHILACIGGMKAALGIHRIAGELNGLYRAAATIRAVLL